MVSRRGTCQSILPAVGAAASIPGLASRLGLGRAQDVEDEQGHADGDGGVGDVEVGPLVVPPVRRGRSPPRSPGEARSIRLPTAPPRTRASADAGQPRGRRAAARSRRRWRARAREAEHGEQQRLVGQVPVGQDAEGGAAVAHVAEAQQPVHEGDVLVQGERADDERLRHLVEDHDARPSAGGRAGCRFTAGPGPPRSARRRRGGRPACRRSPTRSSSARTCCPAACSTRDRSGPSPVLEPHRAHDEQVGEVAGEDAGSSPRGPAAARASPPAPRSTTAASRLAAICFAARASSSAFVTSARTSSRPRPAGEERRRPAVSRCGKSARWTEGSGRPGNERPGLVGW